MPLQIASLNSGSNANCYYVGNDVEAVLIDAGLSCRETLKRMKEIGLEAEKLKAVFISHEHTDHINGLEQLHRKLNLPVYITAKTRRNTVIRFRDDLLRDFMADDFVEIGSLKILPFKKHHDAGDPHSFMVSGDGVNIGVITDVGHACKDVIHCFRQCDAVFLETNYCSDMLAEGSYPASLKKRISSKKGHLSNTQALELFLKYRSRNLQLLILAHLSQNNNSPEKVLSLFQPYSDQVKIITASREEASEVFEIENQKKGIVFAPKALSHAPKQLSLFS